MKIKVIVFDFWQTLISGSDRKIINKLAKELHFKDYKEFWDYCDDNLFAYKTKFDDFLKNLIKKRNIEPTKFKKIKNIFDRGWESVGLYNDTIPTLKKLKENFKLVLLSNTETTTGNHALELFGLKKYFDGIILSCDVGLAKPDTRFFQLVLDEFLVDPSEVLFIGDHIINDIPPAKKLGFKTILLDRERKHQEYKQADMIVDSLNKIDFDSM